MHIGVVCFTCGSLLGDRAKIYRSELKKAMQKVCEDNNIAITKILTDPTIEIDFTDLFEKLRIDSDCCRKHISMAQYFVDYY
jgi:DNA-directed RNA polymerase subunit N (RpoN/RPB10)